MTVETLYYLRARVEGAVPAGPVAADFYLMAEDGPTAGAWAHDICTSRGWSFSSYLALAQTIEAEGLCGEAAAAAKAAREDGYAGVLSPLDVGEGE
jgi:hypothetical protein